MHAEEAVELLNSMTYKPGYSVSAYPHPYLGSIVAVELVLDTHDSSPLPDGSMHRSRIISPAAYFDASGLDEEGVMGAGLKIVLEIEIHEAREFWRRGRGGPAPFHPHNRSGHDAMQRVADIPVVIRYPAPH